jgi:hypothetical protein
MRGKNAGERIFLFAARMNLQYAPLIGRIVFVKPVQYDDMRKLLQPQQGIRIFGVDLDPGTAAIPEVDLPDRVYLEGFDG